MKRSVLLVLDGGAFRNPGLDGELAARGWEAVWTEGAAAVRQAETTPPDLVLFDPAAMGPEGLPALRALRAGQPRLPLAALGAPGQDPAWFDPSGLAPLARVDRAAPETWPEILAGLLGGAEPPRKFTAEDLFGDILSDLEGTAQPAEPGPAAPPAPESRPDPATAPGLAAAVVKTHPGLALPEPAPEEEGVLEQFGNYNLLEKVAVGGMAELFKARQRGVHDFEKTVAIKRILPHLSDSDEFVRMFIDEAKLAAQLSHPNIVQIYDLGKASGFYYIAMEYVDGRDLRSLLRKVREYKLPVPEPLAATIVMKVASALDYAHRKRAVDDRELRLVHRDVSPQNILISYEGAVKLVDFGIAKAASKTTHTQGGSLKGKLLYMSPEQALGMPLDGRSDIYSLGLVLAELLTGERCFQADSELGVLEKVRLGRVVDARTLNPRISPEMGAILDKVLQKDVDQRYASARLLERDLKALLARQGYEPSEHDLAEYVNSLLKGSREDLETLMADRFAVAPVPEPRPQAPLPAPANADEGESTLSGLEPGPPTAPRRPAPHRPAPPPPRSGSLRPWLLAILGLLAVLAALAYREYLLR